MNFKIKQIFLLSIFLIFTKWILITYFNINLSLVSRVINNIEDWQYFTLIYNFSNFNLAPTYDENVLGSKYLAFPIYSILYHSISFKFFGAYSFIIIEFFSIFIFFYTLILFAQRLGLNKSLSLFFVLFIFSLSSILELINVFNIEYLNSIKELYNSRVPRPSITHLYLFYFLALLISINKINQFDLKKLSLIGLLFALMWGSFFINFIISGLVFVFYYFYISKKTDFKIKKMFKDFFSVGISFLIFSLPLIYIVVLNVEPDYVRRVGLISLNLEKKLILLNHIISKILSIKFIFIFIIITIINLYLRFKNYYDNSKIDLLYFIFLSSFLAPIIFIIISPTSGEIYHFTNMIVALSFFVLFLYLLLILNKLTESKIFFTKYLFNIISILLVFFYTFSSFDKINKKSQTQSSKDFYELIKVFEDNSFDKNLPILTFDGKIQTGLILNHFKNFNFVIGINTSVNDDIMEDKIIGIFKYLNLDEDDFQKFIQNEKFGWRYVNQYIGSTFYMKYQANKLTTFENSKDFSNEELEYISKSSPLHSQQLIIPKFEINRLLQKFKNDNFSTEIDPGIIILNNNDFFTKKLQIDDELFCHKKVNKTYEIFYLKSLNSSCFL